MFQLSYVDFNSRGKDTAAKKKSPRILTTINREAGNPDIAMLLAQYDYNQSLLDIIGQNSKASFAKNNYAGAFLVDPFFFFPRFLDQLSERGIRGISNYPSIAFYGEDFSKQLDEVNLGMTREIERLAEARAAGFEVLPCLPDYAGESLIRLAEELLSPSIWLIHSGLQVSQTANLAGLFNPNPNISQLAGEKFFYQRYAELSNLPEVYDGVAKVSWWMMQI